MKLRLFGPGGRVWRLAFRIKHTAKSLKYRQLYNIKGGGGGGIMSQGLKGIHSTSGRKNCGKGRNLLAFCKHNY